VAPSLAVSITGRQLLPKADSAPSDCEDSISIDLRLLRFAVADGATEAFDSRRWARYLTHAWISLSSRTLTPHELVEGVRTLGQRFERKWSGRCLPWYLEEKASNGSFAAFLGLELTLEWTWFAVALGDVCLIVERDRTVQESFPLSSAEEFSSRPTLVASKIDTGATNQTLRVGQGVCLSGDVLLLMSDAIACWYLGQAALSPELLEEFHSALADRSAFSSLVERERTSRRMRNDDVAVIRLVLSVTENGD